MCNTWIEHEEEMKSYEEHYKLNKKEEPLGFFFFNSTKYGRIW